MNSSGQYGRTMRTAERESIGDFLDCTTNSENPKWDWWKYKEVR